jgi:predicted permease
MSPFRRAARRLGLVFFRRRVEAEMAEEMRFHLEQRAAGYAAGGMTESEAANEARRRFGNLTAIRESAWDARGWRWLERLSRDLGFAVRQLVRSPGFSLLAIVTLGLGVGVNTAMFNVLNAISMRALPYPDHAQLDRVYRATAQNPEGGFSAADFLDLVHTAEGSLDVAAYAPANASLSEPGRPAEMAEAARASANLLSLLGVVPQLGRDFQPGDDLPGRDRVVILSQRVWQRRFQASYDVIGRTVRVDGEPHQIIGVLPQSFNDWRHLGWVDFFRPLGLDAREAGDRASTSLRIVTKRAPGKTRADLDALLARVSARLLSQYPDLHTGATWRAVPLDRSVQGTDAGPLLGMLIGLSGFVLLIACSNLANFLLARTMARAREFAVRAALGASRTQLLRPLAAESLVLALAGGAFALAVAQATGRWLSMRSTGDNGEFVPFVLDGRVFGWALGASLLTALAFGVAPALFALRLNLNDTLKSGGRGATAGKGHQRFRQILIVGQFALAMVLLAAAGLFIRGLDDLNNRRAGWESAHVVSGTLLLPSAVYRTPAETTAFHRRAVETLQALPGVRSVSVAAFTPFFNWSDSRTFFADGLARPERGRAPAARVNAVSPRYFETFGTKLLAGRAFNEDDSAAAPKVLVINESLARKLFGTAQAVGRRLVLVNGSAPWGEIVGVVADVQAVLADVTPLTDQVYVPMAQEPRRQCEIAVRSSGVDPAALIASVRAAMTKLDPDLPVRKLRTADANILRTNYQTAVLRDMLTYFAILGLGLACLGIYGVIARLMAQRTGEFAIRLALGASVKDITRLVLASGVTQALLGSGIGLVGAYGISRLLAATQPGMRLNSAGILVATTLLLVGVALVACWMPARRAGRIDATLALRAD